MRRALVGLAGACHPLPSLAVTAFAAALGIAARLDGLRLLLLIVAVGTGQLSVGWLNDYIDRGVDRAAARADKPLVDGRATDGGVRAAMLVAASLCVVSSLALGARPAALHLVAVASAYSYDLGLKRTLASGLPFAVSFGLLPAVVTTSAPGRPFPTAPIWVAGAALGLAAHLANTVKDTEADASTGIRGFPQAIGPRASLILAAGFVAIAGVGLLLARPHSVIAWVCAALAVGAAVLAGVGGRRSAFAGTVGAAGLVVVGLVLSGGALPTG